jgi:hypothetical protein
MSFCECFKKNLFSTDSLAAFLFLKSSITQNQQTFFRRDYGEIFQATLCCLNVPWSLCLKSIKS